MLSIFIKKRVMTLIVFSIIGMALLFLGWRADVLKKKNTVPEVKVSRPVSGAVSFGGAGRPAQEDSIMSGTGVKSASRDASDFFIEYRLERERTRGQRVEYLREVINNGNSANEIRQKAQEHLLAISRNMEKEVELESLVRAKGFKDAAALVDERSVTIIVAAASLSGDETVRIKELASRGTGVEAQNIVVIPRP